MSAPTEAELNRPIPETDPAWACKVAGCREPVPSDVEDQPHCEACQAAVCAVHVVTQCHVYLCLGCFTREESVMLVIANEMQSHSREIRISYALAKRNWDESSQIDLNDIQATCERWVKEIGEVL